MLSKVKKNSKLLSFTAVFALALSGTYGLVKTTTNAATNKFVPIDNKVNIGIVENDKTYEEDGDGANLFDALTGEANSQKTFQIKNIDRLNDNLVDDPNGDEKYPTGDTLVRARIVPSFVYDVEGNAHDDNTIVAMDMTKLDLTVQGVDADNGNKAKGDWYVKETDGEKYYYFSAPIYKDELTDKLTVTAKYNGTIPSGMHLEIRVLSEGVNYNNAPAEGKDGYQFAEEAWNVDYGSDGSLGAKVNY